MLTEEKKLIVNELKSSRFIRTILSSDTKRFSKVSDLSEKARLEGNNLFMGSNHTAQMHEEIFRFYCKSIALAPHNSKKLALAYGNRSAFLFHVQKYEECLLDIDRALEIRQTTSFKEKLLKRKKRAKELIEKRRNSQCTEELAKLSLQPKVEAWSREDSRKSVSIKHNDKYGRHLVANRAFKPGEILFVEEPYVSTLNVRKPYVHCCHCLRVAWTGIPCLNCGWFMFCSEKCREEANTQYHDVECVCLPYILHYINHIIQETGESVVYDGLSLRALMKGLREVGSLEKLKREVLFVDMNKDKINKGFSIDGKFESNQFRSLYSLGSVISTDELAGYVTFAAVILISMIKYSNFFGNTKPQTVNEIIENADMTFVGSLLLRLAKISNVNSHMIKNVNDVCKNSNDVMTCLSDLCCVKGMCITPLASLTNHSCVPNARRCFTEDRKFVLYAIQPIKQNAQIFDSYCCTFFEAPNPERGIYIKESFNFSCDCLACKKNWPAWPLADKTFQNILKSEKMEPEEMKVWNKNKRIIESIESNSALYNQDLLMKVSTAIRNSLKKLDQPSLITCKLIFILMQIFEKLHGYKLEIFNNC